MNSIEELIERDINFQTYLQNRSLLKQYINIRDELINLESIYGTDYINKKYNINTEATVTEIFKRISQLGSISKLESICSKLKQALDNLKRNTFEKEDSVECEDTDKFYEFIKDKEFFITTCENIKVLSELCEIGKNIVFTGKAPSPDDRAVFGLAEGHFNRLKEIKNHFNVNIKKILDFLKERNKFDQISDVKLLAALPKDDHQHYIIIGFKANVETELPNKRRNLIACGKISLEGKAPVYKLKSSVVKEMISRFLGYKYDLIRLNDYIKKDAKDALEIKDEFLNKDDDMYAMNDINFALSIIGPNISINEVLSAVGKILIKYYRAVSNDDSITYKDI